MPVMSIERVIVLGAGAVGGAIGGLLHRAGVSVVLLARGEHGRVLHERGLNLRLPEGEQLLSIPTLTSPAQVTWRAGDLVLWSTKLQDGRAALDDLRAAAGREVPVVCAVNGVDGEVWAEERFSTVLSTLVWLPATHLVPGEVRLYTGAIRGVLDTGPGSELAGEWCRHLRAAGFDALVRDDIARWKHGKWLTNLGSAAQALVEDDWRAVAEEARAEGVRVLARAGLAYVPVEELLERCACVQMTAVDGEERQGGSTWQSHHLGKPMETPWLEGALAALALAHAVAAPVNAALASAAEERRRLTAADLLSDQGSR